LFVRTDSIGDNILAMAMIPHIKDKYPEANITTLCQEHISELYEACPFVDDIVTFDRLRSYEDEEYRSSITQQLQAINADLTLNSVYSREPLTDVFAIGSGAKEKVAFNGNFCNITAEMRDKHAKYYSRLLPSREEHKPELERHRDFLRGLDIETTSLQPVVWTAPEDDRFAEEFFTQNNLKRETTVALFSGVQYTVRSYDRYGAALLEVFKEEDGFTIIAFGTDREHAINQQNLDVLDISTINLCGKTTLRQTAAILKLCRLAVGAETGTAHMACAMGTPNVILLGGGHFGRFMPYSPLTTVVCLPLECYGCNWKCKYTRAHCVRDIRPEMIVAATKNTLEKTSETPRLFVQASSLLNTSVGGPKWKSFEQFLDPKNVDITCIGEDGRVFEADGLYRQPGRGDRSQRSPWLNTLKGPGLTLQGGWMTESESDRTTDSPEKLYQTAQRFMKGGREKEAIGALKVFMALFPNNAQAHNDLGNLYYKGDDKQKALKHYKQAVMFAPDNTTFQKNLADFYYVTLGQVEDAIDHYAKALSGNPADINTLLMLGHINVSKKRFDEAAIFYNAVLKIEPSNREAKEKMDDLRKIRDRTLREQQDRQ
jgi:ADP-heptose:LPS heptosyltransferase/Tfp pilus assembly protein PilF